jgi:hypothetical protein
MREHSHLDLLDVHLSDGIFRTAGTRQWDDSNDVIANPGFRMGRHWTFDLAPETRVVWDVDAIPDDRVSDVPIHLFLSTEARFDPDGPHTPEEVWNLLPRGQAVRGGTIDLQYTKAVDRWRAAGKKLSIGAVLLSGHEAAIEGVHLTNYGAWGAEGFPLVITGGIGQYDRDLIARLDPATHILDATSAIPSHISDCTADGYAPAETNDQVTVRMIVGNMGERNPGEWVQHYRAFAYQSGNRTIASGKNLVQAHTIYQSLRSRIDHNYSSGARIGVYGDFYSSKRIEVFLNEFLLSDHGVQFLLSPTGPGADHYSHEGHVIGLNKITSTGAQVSLDTLGPTTATRYIRDISVDASLSLENNGGTNVTRSGVGLAKKKGCNPFGR